jgi:NAD(P)-dependent dehydrogenase (short-subunit alcohol dehydrogenase family)
MIKNSDNRRIVVITGGAKGIGFQIALRFASDGDIVVLLDADQEAGHAAARSLQQKDLSSFYRETNVAQSDSVRDSIKWVKQQFTGIDILVNCAGILDVGSIEDLDESLWDSVIDVNLKGTYLVTQAAIPCMIGRPNGRIINISSLAGRMGGLRTGLAYSASKAGMIGLTKAIARMVAKHGITVNAIAPGTTNTEMASQFSENDMEAILAAIPLSRLVETDEIAEAVFFLASEKSGMITGTVMDINGGVYMA